MNNKIIELSNKIKKNKEEIEKYNKELVKLQEESIDLREFMKLFNGEIAASTKTFCSKTINDETKVYLQLYEDKVRLSIDFSFNLTDELIDKMEIISEFINN